MLKLGKKGFSYHQLATNHQIPLFFLNIPSTQPIPNLASAKYPPKNDYTIRNPKSDFWNDYLTSANDLIFSFSS